MIDLGTVKPGSTIRIPFSSFDKDDGSSITMTNYAAADILVYKDGSTTERASTAGFTATTDFDGKTGKHLAIIDLADNTTAGFFSAGSEYNVAIDAVTVDGVTTGGWIARFRIGYQDAILDTTIATLASQTSFTLTVGPAEDDALNGCVVLIHDVASAVQLGWALISDYTGSTKTVTLLAGVTFTAATTDNISIFMPRLLPTVAGRTIDLSTGGEAGVDWANVGSPTTTVNLSGTTVGTVSALASGSITAAVIATGAIDADAIADNAIDAGAIASDAITAAKIATGAITAAKFAAGAIDAAAIADGAIDAATFAAGAINAAAIANAAIDAATFAADVDAEILSYLVDDATRIDASALNTASVTTIPAILDDTDLIDDGTSGLAKIATDVAAILVDTAVIGATGAGLTSLASAASITTLSSKLTGLVIVQSTIGATGNDTTHLHLPGLTYGDDEINDHLLIIFDVSTSEYHSRWIEDWADTGDLATVTTLPFTPQDSVDTYWLLSIRRNVTASTVAAGAITSGSFAAGAINASAIAADAITDAKVASDVTIASVTGAVGSVTGAVGSVTGAVGSVTGNVGGNVTGAVGSIATGGITTASFAAGAINAAAIGADAITAAKVAPDVHEEQIELSFTYDATATYAGANAGSLVKQIADNAGGSALTPDAIVEAMFTYDATATYATANAGSAVKQIADNAGGSALTVDAIADEVETRTIAGVTLVATTTNLTNLPTIPANWLTAAGTAADFSTEVNAGVLAVLGALNDAAADGAVTTTDTMVAYLKQIINTLEGAPGIPTWPASAAPGNAVSIAEAIRQIYDNLNTVDDLLDTEVGALTTELAKVPKSDSTVTWNATALASIQSEATDALNAYDPPTHAELTSGLAAADDATLAAIAALNNLSAAQVNAEVDTALADINLDHLMKIAVDTDFNTTVHANSVVGYIASTNNTYDRSTDSQEAIRNRGDAAWITATGFSTHSAADVWAVGTRTITGGTVGTVTGLTIANVENMATRFLGMIEVDGAVYRFTVNALEQGPAGGGGSAGWETTDIEDGETPGDILRLLRAAQVGDRTKSGNTWTFKSKDGATSRIVATVTPAQRDVTSTDPTT